jgi:outer membrane protein OmpA-like peptidoglycan-associated protein
MRKNLGLLAPRSHTLCFALLSIVLLLQGCAQPKVKGAYPPPTPNFIGGAGVGAPDGATIGSGLIGSGSSATTGLFGGAILGASMGSYHDTEGLIQTLAAAGITVIRLGDIVEIVVPSDYLFRGHDNEVQYSAYPMMDKIVWLLLQYGNGNISVHAHSDDIGNPMQKLQMTEKQSQSVASYLWSRGIPLTQMTFNGFGDQISTAQFRTLQGSAYNRRVEITMWREHGPEPLTTWLKSVGVPLPTLWEPQTEAEQQMSTD